MYVCTVCKLCVCGMCGSNDCCYTFDSLNTSVSPLPAQNPSVPWRAVHSLLHRSMVNTDSRLVRVQSMPFVCGFVAWWYNDSEKSLQIQPNSSIMDNGEVMPVSRTLKDALIS